MSWRDEAACRDAPDPDEFFPKTSKGPGSGESGVSRVRRLARKWCARCPVLDECAAEADEDKLIGLWGGVYRYGGAGRYQWTKVLAVAPDPRPRPRKPGPPPGIRAAS
ncbi:WhiB family transcriptional regulator [Pseudonocardia sp. WMMC193]|uniref:WhiB family transcriptional regulator n=1 Tax=Pseudonocardia sp. WMMC193 TaxID=2911965 RepID=UPI001F3EDE12|nr:WhiB family transcriptional regulator [Pseudonocardia sp. WMMC193]MCF7550998.1 WhiB family transcriptional regulator [Pseudonocardia sp. WMMC193]